MAIATVDNNLNAEEKTSRSRRIEIWRRLYGGAERVRTADLRLAKPALSQLSYCPESASSFSSEAPSFSRLSRIVDAMNREKKVNPKISARMLS
jgi:hypothetical protein